MSSVAPCSSEHASSSCFRAPAKLGSGTPYSADTKRELLHQVSQHPSTPPLRHPGELSATLHSFPTPLQHLLLLLLGTSHYPTADHVSGQHPPKHALPEQHSPGVGSASTAFASRFSCSAGHCTPPLLSWLLASGLNTRDSANGKDQTHYMFSNAITPLGLAPPKTREVPARANQDHHHPTPSPRINPQSIHSLPALGSTGISLSPKSTSSQRTSLCSRDRRSGLEIAQSVERQRSYLQNCCFQLPSSL